ncbi:MAG: cytochrome c biogenesis protein CcdA [Breznakibacter sp.]
MKQKVLVAILLLVGVKLSAQMAQPVKWTFSLKAVDAQTIDVVAQASIDDGWHAYSVNLPDGGPIPTTFTVLPDDAYELVGTVKESPKAEVHDDATFGMKVGYILDKGKVIQRIKLKQAGEVAVKGELEFMACNDESCLPPDVLEFSLKYLPKAEVVARVLPTTGTDLPAIPVSQKTEESGSKADTSKMDVAKTEPMVAETRPVVGTTADGDIPQSYWAIFWLAFGGGLVALLTPCVFPMIPMTVSFFTKQSKNKAAGIRNAILYGISIIVIYVLLGTVVTAIFGADSLNALSTDPWFNLFFALLLIVFAISFFGAFEIVLPSKWVNAADRNADRGGLIGIFFMAFTLALVSFSCTGPIVGSLIVQAAREGGMAPVVGMLGFSLAIALPFAFFAAFPGYLNSLPKSGGWLNSVKVVLGFIELAFAFKFLSVADMVLELHWLERELFIAVWIAIAIMIGLYLLGAYRLPHDSPMEKVPVPRFLLAIASFAFAVYLIPGMWGAPVNLISGFPPPKEYAESPFGVNQDAPSLSTAIMVANGGTSLPEGMHHGPQGIPAFDDYGKALAYARKVKKPLLIDFTGKGCVNCRKMEDMVWSKSEVKGLLTNDYVLVSLYVDLRTLLPDGEQYVSPSTGKRIRTVGNKWSDFQITRYHRNSQPHYVIVDGNERELVPFKAYDPDVQGYIDWLKRGMESYKGTIGQ